MLGESRYSGWEASSHWLHLDPQTEDGNMARLPVEHSLANVFPILKSDLVFDPEMLSTLKESDVHRMAQRFNTLPRDSLQLLKSKFRDQKGWQVSYTHNENNIRTQHTQDRRISNVCARVRNRCVSPVPWSVHMQTYMRTNTDSHEDKGSSCGSDIYHRTVNLCMFIHRL